MDYLIRRTSKAWHALNTVLSNKLSRVKQRLDHHSITSDGQSLRPGKNRDDVEKSHLLRRVPSSPNRNRQQQQPLTELERMNRKGNDWTANDLFRFQHLNAIGEDVDEQKAICRLWITRLHNINKQYCYLTWYASGIYTCYYRLAILVNDAWETEAVRWCEKGLRGCISNGSKDLEETDTSESIAHFLWLCHAVHSIQSVRGRWHHSTVPSAIGRCEQFQFQGAGRDSVCKFNRQGGAPGESRNRSVR